MQQPYNLCISLSVLASKHTSSHEMCFFEESIHKLKSIIKYDDNSDNYNTSKSQMQCLQPNISLSIQAKRHYNNNRNAFLCFMQQHRQCRVCISIVRTPQRAAVDLNIIHVQRHRRLCCQMKKTNVIVCRALLCEERAHDSDTIFMYTRHHSVFEYSSSSKIIFSSMIKLQRVGVNLHFS